MNPQKMLTTDGSAGKTVSQEETIVSTLFDNIQRLRRMEFGELKIVKHQGVLRIELTTKTQISG